MALWALHFPQSPHRAGPRRNWSSDQSTTCNRRFVSLPQRLVAQGVSVPVCCWRTSSSGLRAVVAGTGLSRALLDCRLGHNSSLWSHLGVALLQALELRRDAAESVCRYGRGVSVYGNKSTSAGFRTCRGTLRLSRERPSRHGRG